MTIETILFKVFLLGILIILGMVIFICLLNRKHSAQVEAGYNPVED